MQSYAILCQQPGLVLKYMRSELKRLAVSSIHGKPRLGARIALPINPDTPDIVLSALKTVVKRKVISASTIIAIEVANSCTERRLSSIRKNRRHLKSIEPHGERIDDSAML